MAGTGSKHRPLVAGTFVRPGRVRHGSGPNNFIDQIHDGGGTLTGLATRISDNQEVLVTCQHVLVGYDPATDNYRSPQGDEEMYQTELVAGDKVGGPVTAATIDPNGTNTADIAYCPLISGTATDPGPEASFRLHTHPTHQGKDVVAGVLEPKPNQTYKLFGQRGGEVDITVTEVDKETTINGTSFTGMAFASFARDAVRPGDSGAPVVKEVGDQVNTRWS